MSENSEYKLEGGYEISEVLYALRAAVNLMQSDPSTSFENVHRLRALMTSLGTLARDMTLIDWLDKQCEVIEDRDVFGDRVEYRWRFSQVVTHDNRRPAISKRQHVRQILTTIRDSSFQRARKVEYLEPKIDG